MNWNIKKNVHFRNLLAAQCPNLLKTHQHIECMLAPIAICGAENLARPSMDECTSEETCASEDECMVKDQVHAGV